MSAYSLANNAFAVLHVSLRADRAAIIEAHDERLFEGGDESTLDAARARLTVPRDRIEEEVSFLPELTPARAREVIKNLAQLNSVEGVEDLVSKVENLAKLNVLRELLRRFPTNRKLLASTIRADWAFDPSAARRSIEEARGLSGFGSVKDEVWTKAISGLRDAHAATLAHAITSLPDGPQELTKILESNYLDAEPSEWHRAVLERVVDRYDRWSEPHLGKIEERLDFALAAVRETPTDPSLLSDVEQAIVTWDAISQPVQLREQVRGLDEARSRRIYVKVRDVAIWLANENQLFEAARQLSAALQKHFPELPSVVKELAQDIQTLDELLEDERSRELVAPLYASAESAKKNLSAFAADIVNGHFAANGQGLAAQLYEGFESAKALADRLTNRDIPWLVVRSVAIDLYNDADAPKAAELLLAHIATSAEGEIASRLKDDLRTARVGALSTAFGAAAQAGDLARAEDLLDELIAADSADRARYQGLKSVIAQRRTQRNLKRWGWAAAAAVLFVYVIAQSSGTGSGSSSYTPSTYEPDTTAPTDMNVVDASAVADTGAESPPPAYYQGELTRAQLRYCLFEDRRMKILQAEVPPANYSDFNVKVRDFNSRCSNTRYLESDKDVIEGEVIASEINLNAEAQKTLAKWEAANAPSLDVPSTASREQSAATPASTTWVPSPVDPDSPAYQTDDPSSDDTNGNLR